MAISPTLQKNESNDVDPWRSEGTGAAYGGPGGSLGGCTAGENLRGGDHITMLSENPRKTIGKP